jgi:hypothetical protein
MELFIFARFHTREGRKAVVAALLREQTERVREEQGCLATQAYPPSAIRGCSTSIRVGWTKRHSRSTPSCPAPSSSWSG